MTEGRDSLKIQINWSAPKVADGRRAEADASQEEELFRSHSSPGAIEKGTEGADGFAEELSDFEISNPRSLNGICLQSLEHRPAYRCCNMSLTIEVGTIDHVCDWIPAEPRTKGYILTGSFGLGRPRRILKTGGQIC